MPEHMPQALTSRQILEKLVAFDSTSRNSNLELILWVADFLGMYGVESRILKNPTGNKANLIATVGPNVAGGVVLSGHSDVVPVVGQNWSSDPFCVVERNGALFGRGTADMKGFIACALAAVPQFVAANLKRPVHLILTYDEEVGCLGIQSLLVPLRQFVASPRLVVVGEPTSMKVACGHKGQTVYRTRITGKAAHSSRPQDGVNAVFAAARLISKLAELAEEAKSGPQDALFDPPYTSVNIGPITGGSAFNIVADACVFEWDQRPIPGESAARIEQPYAQLVAEMDRELKVRDPLAGVHHEAWASLPPLAAKPGSDGEVLALSLAAQNHTEVVAFGTEAGYIQEACDWPVVVCGPGDISEAHKPDEFISLAQLAAADRFMARVCKTLCG